MSTVYKFADSCVITFNADRQANVAWENGKALDAVTGAAIDYIPKHMKLTCNLIEGKYMYNFQAQYELMVSGTVNPKLAFIICLMRKIVIGLTGLELNSAEVVTVAGTKEDVVFAPEVVQMVDRSPEVLKAILNQSVTILALNAINILVQGHHYQESQSVWRNLNKATNLSTHFEELGITDWEGPIFHDTFHPFDIQTLAKWACKEDSNFAGKVNGVVTKRLPASPAGTIILSVCDAMLHDIAGLVPKVYKVVKSIRKKINDLQTKIKASPLDWCAHFTRKDTAANLSQITEFERMAAFLYGVLEAATREGKKPSALRSQAIKGCVNRNFGVYQMGLNTGERLKSEEVSVDNLMSYMRKLTVDLVGEELMAEQESEEESEEEAEVHESKERAEK
jgi:hypothetical protein